jgi:hypothetical protein
MRLARGISTFVLATALSLPLVACGSSGDDDGDDDDDVGACYDDPGACVDPTGSDTQYVADTITMPTSATQAQQLGIDLDGDPQGRPDNALGQILSTLASQGDINLQESINEQVDDGGLILLFNLKATGLTTAVDAGGWIYLGDNPSPEPCTTADPPVCGQHLSGQGTFDVAASSPTDAVLHGDIIGSKLTGGPGKVTLELALGDIDPITVNMIGARMEVNVATTALTSGKIGGAVTQAELDNNVLPAIVTVMDESISEDCLGAAPTCCTEGSTGETLIDLFDEDDDCAVSLEELRTNDLISSLLSPDVDLLDENGDFNPRVDEVKDSLSLGIGFSAVGASFTP